MNVTPNQPGATASGGGQPPGYAFPRAGTPDHRSRVTGRLTPAARRVALLLLACLGCGGDKEPDGVARSKPVIVVATFPLREMAERIGGDAFEVIYPVPDDVDANAWRPADADVATLQSADLILVNGARYSGWRERTSLPDDTVVDTCQRVRDRLIGVKDFTVHRHGGEGAHSHPGTAPNTFLDPALALKQAELVRDALIELRPDDADAITERFEAYANELREIDAAYEDLLKDAPETPVLASHPFCSYVGRRANWDLVHLHWKPDEMPDAEGWDRLEELLIDHPATWMLWSAAPSPEIGAELAKRGIAIAVLNPAARPPKEGDFLDVLRSNLDVVRKVVKNERPKGPVPDEPASAKP